MAPVHGRDSSARPSSTSYHPKKKLFNRLHALITSPKRALGHAEREGVGVARPRTGSVDSHASGISTSSADAASTSAASISSVVSPTGLAVELSDRPDHQQTITSAQADGNIGFGSGAGVATRTANGADIDDYALSDVPLQRVLVRPHLKIRIVTWNMHDSLPTGDLTELLGHPVMEPSVGNGLDGASTTPIEPFDPEHPVQPLSSAAFDHTAPFHLVVVGGQEVPVGYGGWAGPNWTEIIQRWLENASSFTPVRAQSTELPPLNTQAANLQGSAVADDETSPLPPTGQGKSLRPSAPVSRKENDMATAPSDSNNPAIVIKPSSSSHAAEQTDHSDTAAASANLGVSGLQATRPALESHDSTATTSTATSASSTSTTVPARFSTAGKPPASDIKLRASPVTPDSMYKLVAKERLMGIYISVWAHKSIAGSSEQEDAVQMATEAGPSTPPKSNTPARNVIQGTSTGVVTAGLLNGKWGNKGAACVAVHVADTRLLFVCAHLAAHSEKTSTRQQNVRKIKEELVIDTFRKPTRSATTSSKSGLQADQTTATATAPTSAEEKYEKDKERLLEERKERLERGEDVTDAFDYTFWFGDLNFRLDISRLHADFLIKQKQWETALTFDQLAPILKDPQGCFEGFHEAKIDFAPSYKYDVLKLKRARNLQRRDTGTSISSLADIRRNKHMSAPQPMAMSASASRSTLPIDEGDETDAGDHATLSSSRASISSAFSGFEAAFDDDGNPIPRDQVLARDSSSNPSTPSAERVIMDKAKNFFNLVRSKSTGPNPPGTPLTPSSSVPTAVYPPPPSPRSQSPAFNPFFPKEASPDTGVDARDFALQRSSLELVADQQNSPVTDDNKLPSTNKNREKEAEPKPSRPPSQQAPRISISSPGQLRRPRLQSNRSTQTLLSLTESQQQEREEQLERDSVYDTSSKKRVQSWTDRILFKSTIPVHMEDGGEASKSEQSKPFGSGFLDSLREVKRNILAAGSLPVSPAPSVPEPRGLHRSGSWQHRPRKGQHKVSFSPSTIQEDGPAVAPGLVALMAQRSADAAEGDADPAKLPVMRRNTSQSSISSDSAKRAPAGSQQRLNHRFAKLFSRQNSEKHSDASEPDVNDNDSAQARNLATNTERIRRESQDSFAGAASSPRPRKLSRSLSASLYRRSSSGNVPKLRVKPGRSHTTPAPPFSATSSANATPTFSASATFDSLSPLVPSTRSAVEDERCEENGALSISPEDEVPPSQRGSRQRASSDVARVVGTGLPSPLLDTTTATAEESPGAGLNRQQSLPAASRKRSSTFCAGLEESQKEAAPMNSTGTKRSFETSLNRRAFSFGNSLAASHESTTSDGHSREGKRPPSSNDLDLPHSKTVPLPSQSPQNNRDGVSALRQWWQSHHSFLPSFLQPHHDSSALDGTSPMSLTDGNTPKVLSPSGETPSTNDVLRPPSPPPPKIIGPRRGEVECLTYDSIADLRRMQAQSDHRPVVGVFAIGI